MRASVRRRTSAASSESHCSLPDLYRKRARPVFGAGPPPRVFGAGPPPQAANPIVRCRTSAASMHAQCSPLPQACAPSVRRRTSTASSESHCSLPDLYRKHAGPVFGAGPPPRAANPIVRCRTFTASVHAQCSAPDLHREQRIPLFAAGPLPQACTPSVMVNALKETSRDTDVCSSSVGCLFYVWSCSCSCSSHQLSNRNHTQTSLEIIIRGLAPIILGGIWLLFMTIMGPETHPLSHHTHTQTHIQSDIFYPV